MNPLSATDLTAFLAARLDEDERAAAVKVIAGPWHVDDEEPWAVGTGISDEQGRGIAAANGGYAAAHIARHDPACVLRDVAADRKLIAAYEDVSEFSDPWIGLDIAVRIRAERFSDHPDYRPEWRP